MFTDQELKDLHYQMWDYIVNKIIENQGVINITEAKIEFLESQNIDLDTMPHACPMCKYNNQRLSLSDLSQCQHCPSSLNVSFFRGCLSGIYNLCLHTKSYSTELILALAIRDSWKE